MSGRVTRQLAVADRELRTAARSKPLLAVLVLVTVVIIGLGTAAQSRGFVPVALSLLTPLELLVPILAVAVGYRAIAGDRASGELAVLRTTPVSPHTHVLGVVVGRLAVVLAGILLPLTVVGLSVAMAPTVGATFLAHHAALDSPLLFARFVALTAWYAVVVVTVVIALSAAVGDARRGLAAATGAVVALGVGLDLAAVIGLTTEIVPAGALEPVLALSPASAYRGLVFSLVVAPTGTVSTPTASVAANVAGLVIWTGAAITVATYLIDTSRS